MKHENHRHRTPSADDPWGGRRLRSRSPSPLGQALAIGTFLLSITLPFEAGAAETVQVTRSSPAEGAVLEAPTRTVTLWLDGGFDPATAHLEITGPTGVLEVGGVHTMGNDELMGQILGAMPDGSYELSWRVTGTDGETSGGKIRFSVRRGGSSTADEWEPPLDIGVVLYDGAEPLDVFGPLEMWMNAGPSLIRVHLIAEEKGPVIITTTGYPTELAPRLEAQYSFEEAPDLDVIMVPGGLGTLREVENEKMLSFLREASKSVALTTSVCTGSALLARAGILDGERATGNKVFFDYARQQGPEVEWVPEARWVESGRVMTSSGVSAGIDMSLAVIARFFGVEGARMVAAMTEYEWQEDSSRDPFAKYLNMGMAGIERLEASAKKMP